MTPTFGSLFAGVGGFDLGFEAAGYTCGFQVEWDKHCQQVLAHRWPDTPRWGDVSEVSGYDLPPVDVITYGFPCQDLSIAGKRAGLDGDRSNLFFQAIRIIKEMREATNGMAPTFAVAENVVGLLNADGGDAMARVVDTLAEAGAVGIEWCVLDAQWFGVPQRRRRVFVTACFDSATFARCPDPLFPVADSGARNPAEIDQERQEVASTLGGGSGSRGWSPDTDRMTFIPFGREPETTQETTHEVVGALQARSYKGPNHENARDGQLVIQHPVEPFRMLGFGHYEQDNSASALKARDYKDATDLVSFVKSRRAQTSENAETWIGNAPAPTLNRFDNGGESRATVVTVENLAVRRLTPTECERLMGWPDNHTLHRADGKQASDSQRYKQCGNGVVAPVAQWIAKHLKNALCPPTS